MSLKEKKLEKDHQNPKLEYMQKTEMYVRESRKYLIKKNPLYFGAFFQRCIVGKVCHHHLLDLPLLGVADVIEKNILTYLEFSGDIESEAYSFSKNIDFKILT